MQSYVYVLGNKFDMVSLLLNVCLAIRVVENDGMDQKNTAMLFALFCLQCCSLTT